MKITYLEENFKFQNKYSRVPKLRGMNKNCIVLVFRIFSETFGTSRKRISTKIFDKNSGSQDRTPNNQALQMKQPFICSERP